MDVETLFSGRYGVDGVASPYPVCLSLPSIRGIKGTNGAPTHIMAHTRVVYLRPADNFPRLTRRLSKDLKGLYEWALMASPQPSEPW